jgi:hypothetical protein
VQFDDLGEPADPPAERLVGGTRHVDDELSNALDVRIWERHGAVDR